MNKTNFNQTGGFPLETDTLDFMQSAYHQLQALSALGSAVNYILKGCETQGKSTASGFVVIGGEILEFRGGYTQAHIIVREEAQSRPFENGQQKPLYYTRYATFGIGTGAIAWADMLRIKDLAQFRNLPTATSSEINLDQEDSLATSKAVNALRIAVQHSVPSGVIVMWSGTLPPEGWALCDGTHHTPDLRNRFVMGAGNEPVNTVGGNNQMYVNKNNLPNIKIPLKVFGTKRGAGNDPNDQALSKSTTSGFGSTGTLYTEPLGDGTPLDNRPAYYVLAFIMKLPYTD